MDVYNKDFFFKYFVGSTPDNEENIRVTDRMIRHLKDSGINKDTMLGVYDSCAADKCITNHNIPRNLWEENNLVDGELVYIHPELCLVSPAPYFNTKTGEVISKPFYRETRELYTMEQLLSYCYKSLYKIDQDLYDNERDTGALNYLLKKYGKIKDLHSIDFVLYLIDEGASDGCSSILRLADYEQTVLKNIRARINNLSRLDMLRIIWRP